MQLEDNTQFLTSRALYSKMVAHLFFFECFENTVKTRLKKSECELSSYKKQMSTYSKFQRFYSSQLSYSK